MNIGSQDFKRTTSLLTNKPEKVVDIDDKWKTKASVTENSLSMVNTKERIFKPASNVERKEEDGCMKKLRFERSLKLRKEDTRGRDFNVLSNT